MSGEAKACAICGTDVSDQPRIKDSKGRYACKPCAEKKARAAKAKKQARAKTPAPAPAPGGASMMEQWMSDSTEGQIALGAIEQPTCPNCEHPMMPDSVVCMGCGTNVQTGKKLRTQIKKADKEPKGAGGGGLSLTLAGDPTTLSLVCLLAAIGLIAGTALAGELGMLFFVVSVIWVFLAGLLMIISAFQDGDNFWGIVGIAQFLPFIGQLASLAFVLYYCTVGSTRTVRKISYWCAFIAVLGCTIAFVFSNPQIFAET